MSKNIVLNQAYMLWLSESNACEQALSAGIDHINKSATRLKTIEDFRFLNLVSDLIKYCQYLDVQYQDEKSPLILKDKDYLLMVGLLSFAQSLVNNEMDFTDNDDKNYETLLSQIKSKLGDNVQDFYDFVNLVTESMSNDAVIEEQKEQNPIDSALYNKLLNLQRHKDILEKSKVLQNLVGNDYEDTLRLINSTLAEPPKEVEALKHYTALVEQLDKKIWSDEIRYTYELLLLEQQMKILNITRYFPALFSDEVSSKVKNTLDLIEKEHKKKDNDIKLLTETIRELRSYLADPNVLNLEDLNTYLDAFPKNSPIMFYLKAMLITSICLSLATAAIAISIQFGVDFSVLMDPVNQVVNGLTSIYPPLKDMGLAVYNGVQKTAFVLPGIMSGDAVPIWSLLVGATAGAALGLAGGKAAQLMLINNKDDVLSEFSEHDDFDETLSESSEDDDFDETFSQSSEDDENYDIDDSLEKKERRDAFEETIKSHPSLRLFKPKEKETDNSSLEEEENTPLPGKKN